MLYFGAGVASIVVIDSARRSRPSSRPHLADRPHRQTESTLAYDAIPPRVFLEQSREGIHILDRNGKLRGANRKFEEMLGYSHEEVKNLHVWDWDAQWTREELLERIGGSDSGGASFETRHRRKDGVVIDVEISAAEWSGGSNHCTTASPGIFLSASRLNKPCARARSDSVCWSSRQPMPSSCSTKTAGSSRSITWPARSLATPAQNCWGCAWSTWCESSTRRVSRNYFPA